MGLESIICPIGDSTNFFHLEKVLFSTVWRFLPLQQGFTTLFGSRLHQLANRSHLFDNLKLFFKKQL